MDTLTFQLPFVLDWVVIRVYVDEGVAEGCVVAAVIKFEWRCCCVKLIHSRNVNNGETGRLDHFYFSEGSSPRL